MASLTPGGMASFSLDPFDYLTVVADRFCLGTISATSGALNLQPSQRFGIQNRQYGPFGVPMDVVIAVSSGSMTYTIVEGSGGSGTGVTSATAAEIAALALAGTLAVPGIYFDAATGLYSFTQTDSTYQTQQQGIFRGTYAWAARPVTGITVGDTIRVSDVGAAPGTMFIWTGSVWRNLYPYTIGGNVGSVASPVATISAATSGVFTIPTPISIPADLFAAGSRATLVAVLRKNGATATNTWNAYLGTAGGITDSLIRTEAGTINNGRIARFDVDIWFPSTTVATGVQNVAPQANGSNAVTDVSTNINTAAAMSVTIAVASGNVSDSYELLSCGLVVGAA